MRKIKTNYLEIIELRSNNIDLKILNSKLIEFKDELNTKKENYNVKLYRHLMIETDWVFHLHYQSEIVNTSQSELGLSIASILQEFGLVHHSVWAEDMDKENRGSVL